MKTKMKMIAIALIIFYSNHAIGMWVGQALYESEQERQQERAARRERERQEALLAREGEHAGEYIQPEGQGEVPEDQPIQIVIPSAHQWKYFELTALSELFSCHRCRTE